MTPGGGCPKRCGGLQLSAFHGAMAAMARPAPFSRRMNRHHLFRMVLVLAWIVGGYHVALHHIGNPSTAPGQTQCQLCQIGHSKSATVVGPTEIRPPSYVYARTVIARSAEPTGPEFSNWPVRGPPTI